MTRLTVDDVDDTCAGVAIVSNIRLAEGDRMTFSAVWRDRSEGVPAERWVIAAALRALAERLEQEAEALG